MRKVFVRGMADGICYDFECRQISFNSTRAIFDIVSGPNRIVEISPRYKDQTLSDSGADEKITCFFAINGEYMGLAFFSVTEDEILIEPHDY